MKFLRTLNYLYLSLLPALTYPAIVLADAQHISGWYNLLFFLAVILYIPLINQYSPFPKTLSAGIITTVAIPLQIFLALYFGHFGNIWLLFAYQFLIEGSGLLIGAIFAGAFGQFGTKQIKIFGQIFRLPTFKQWVSLLILIIPAFVIIRLLGPMFADLSWSWPMFFLFSALMTAANRQFIRLQKNEKASTDDLENMPFIVIGFLSLIILGPMLGQFFGGN